jgi:Family of unknown function (DUF6152)
MRSIAGVLLSFVGQLAGAHHSVNAFFDQSRIAEIEGIVTRVLWQNPHVGIELRVDGTDGIEEWSLISSSINSLERNNLARDSIRTGDRVRAAGWPDRRAAHSMFITNFLLANGREVRMTATKPQPFRWTRPADTADTSARQPVAVAEGDDRGLFKVWVRGAAYTPRRPIRFTDSALAAQADWDPLTDDPVLECIAPGMPNAILNPYPIEFIDQGDTITLRIEEWHATRSIHLNDVRDPATVPPSPLGFSIGHWEGSTLAVETTRVSWPYLDGDGTPQTVDVRMIERFTLADGGARLDYELTVSEPTSLEVPAVWDAYWLWDPSVTIKPYDCRFEPQPADD